MEFSISSSRQMEQHNARAFSRHHASMSRMEGRAPPCSGPYGNFLTNLNVCKSIIGPGHIINLANDSFYDPLHSEAMH